MTIAAVLLGELTCVAGMMTFGGPPAWYAWLVIPVACLAGPLSPLLRVLHLVPANAVPEVPMPIGLYGLGVVVLYGLSVAWFLRKPSGWSKTVFIILSVLWVFFGWVIAASPI
jgi:hypothetical protein